jgi:hypothetical protein
MRDLPTPRRDAIIGRGHASGFVGNGAFVSGMAGLMEHE